MLAKHIKALSNSPMKGWKRLVGCFISSPGGSTPWQQAGASEEERIAVFGRKNCADQTSGSVEQKLTGVDAKGSTSKALAQTCKEQSRQHMTAGLLVSDAHEEAALRTLQRLQGAPADAWPSTSTFQGKCPALALVAAASFAVWLKTSKSLHRRLGSVWLP